MKPVLITVHMLLAIVIVFVVLFLFVWVKSADEKAVFSPVNRRLNVLTVVVMGLSTVQILLGTQVREEMDEVIRMIGYGDRGSWIDQLGVRFYVHRSFSIIVIGANVFWFYLIREDTSAVGDLRKVAGWCLAIVAFEIVTGIVLAYLGVPAPVQPIHLTLAIGLIGLQFAAWLLINGAKYLDNVRVAHSDN